MAFSILLDSRAGVFIATCSGTITLEECKQGAAAYWENPERGGRPILWDLRDARVGLDAPEVREIAQFVLQNQPTAPPPRVAFVTDRDVDFGLARMFEGFRENPATTVRVFRNFDEALSWTTSPAPRSN